VKTRTIHNNEQIDYFTRRPIDRMELSNDIDRRYIVRQATAVRDATHANLSDRIIDVGCGPGRYSNVFLRLGHSVEAMDLTPRVVKSLRDSSPHIPAHIGDLMAPPSELLGRFDIVTGFFVLHHVHDLAAALRGASSLLRPGGRLAFCEPNPFFLGYAAQIAGTRHMSFRGEAGILRMRKRLLQAACKSAGLKNFAVVRFGLFPPKLANHRFGAAIEERLERIPIIGHVRAFQVFSAEKAANSTAEF
jgi:2-polyprenyl-3-methyl-5-hydroxy-6-metoxy-1,4-benzoquinol methylase